MMSLSSHLVCLLVLVGAEGQNATTQRSAKFAVHDQNGDGVWTRAELKTPADVAAFLAADHNGDFRVPLAEYLVAAAQPANPAWKAFLKADANHDGSIARKEFLPVQGAAAALAAAEAEFVRHDRDQSGRLDPAEFLGTGRSGLSHDARFLWVDANGDGRVELRELASLYAGTHEIHARLEWWYCGREAFPEIRLEDWRRRDGKRTRAAADELWLRDANHDQKLTLDEFAGWEYGAPTRATRQTFGMFDFDGNGTLDVAEFQAVPGTTPEPDRVVPDPIIAEYDRIRGKMLAVLRDSAQETWTEATWPVNQLADSVGPPALVAARVWDFNQNGVITMAEFEQCLRGACGLDTWTEPPVSMRRPQSLVFNQIYFDALDQDHDGRISRDEFVKRHFQGPEENQKTFAKIDANNDQFIDVAEALAGPWFLTNMVNEFRRMDLDLDGRIDPQEFDKQTYEWHSSLKAYIFPAFDRNGDGFLSLQEYRETPAANQALAWFGAHQDTDGSGTLTFDEFAPPATGSPPLKLAFLRLFVFHRFDLNSDQRLDPQEFPFSVNLAALTAKAAFQYQDQDRSGGVSWEELSKGLAANRHPALRQLLVVFDTDSNQQLEFGEFCALPDFCKPADRVVPDPVRIERDRFLTALTAAVRSADSNQDGRWSQNEWPAAAVLLPVLKEPAATAHPAWDFDKDGNVTSEELGLGADLAFGLIDPAERKWPWHLPNGTVFIGYNWEGFDKNRDRTVTLDEFRASFWAKDQADNRFSEMDRDQDGKVSPAEIFATSWMLQNVVGEFLRIDTDHDGKVSHDELASGVEPWRKQQVAMTFPGFDTNGDGGLTFAEYRLAPVANPVINWSTPQADLNDDGLLDFSEFFPERKLSSPVWLCGLARVVFERLDRNLDQRLDPYECMFSGKNSSLTAEGVFRLRDQDRSGAVNWAELSKGLSADRHPALRQLFVVFDADSNQELDFAEFRALPDFVNPVDRVVPDSLRNERDRFLTSLKSTLRSADLNQDERWTQNEWPATALLPVLKDVLATRHHAWDLDKNGTVTAEELAVGADLAFGLIDPVQRQASWHTHAGTVFSGSNWGAFDKNRDMLVTREEFLANFWAKAEAPKRFGEIDRDQDGTISAAEMFATNWMYVNVIGEFLRLDADRDGGVSNDELEKGVEDWRKKVAAMSFPGFDTSGDGSLNLAEFRLTPIGNPVINWGVAQMDQNGDGLLDPSEFFPERTQYGPLWLCGLTPLVFHHLDRDADGQLNSAEYDLQGKLAIQLAQPEWGPDPVLMRFERTLEEFRGWLAASDRNRDGQLSENEWPRSEIEQTFPVPDLHSFASWDVNLNGRVSLEEFQYVLREAWGITSQRCPEEWLRRGSGHIVDFIAFRTVDIDGNGQLSRTEFLEKFYGTPAERAKWYPEIDRDADGVITMREMLATGRLLLMPRDLFQKFDSQRDGKLTPREIASNALSWQKASAALCFPAFDVDHDGFLSPDEFRWTPIANPLIPWTRKPTDTDHDGTLSLDEFYSPPVGESRNWLALLAHEYLSRWDRNHDGKLALDEYDFSLDVSKLDPLAAFPLADKNHDGGLSPEEVFLDARPDAKNAGAVINYHRRKMRSEEAFLGADLDRNRLLNPGEYQKYHGYMQGVAEPNRPAPAIPPARVTRTWDEFFTWGMLGIDLLLAVVGGVYWALRRRAAN